MCWTMDADNSNSIHSGHFMVSCIYEADDDGEAVGSVKPEPYRQGYNFEAADWQLRKAYMFGSRSTNTLAIDASLTKLFECMTLAYRYVIKKSFFSNFVRKCTMGIVPLVHIRLMAVNH